MVREKRLLATTLDQAYIYVNTPIPMQASDISASEELRLQALRSYDILDTAGEQIFDDITAAAAEICQAPIALLSFVDRDRQWFKSNAGTSMKETDRDVSFCAHAIEQKELFVVQNACTDARFADNALVTGDPKIRFYAGMPMINSDQYALGTLCVIDYAPRELTRDQAENLRALAQSAMRILDLRREHGSALFAKAAEETPVGITVVDVRSHDRPFLYVNRRFCEMTGYSYHELIGRDARSIGEKHTDWSAVEQRIANKETVTVEFVLQGKGTHLCWDRFSALPYLSKNGDLLYVLGLHLDITADKEIEVERQQLQAVRATMHQVNDIVLNFMNNLQLYRMHMEEDWGVGRAVLKEFDSIFDATLSRMSKINELETLPRTLAERFQLNNSLSS
jgi:PAS domain S-box-containing protein